MGVALGPRQHDRSRACERFSPAGVLDKREIEAACRMQWQALVDQDADARAAIIKLLSGGNQQKVLVSRWLLTLPEILMIDEPTRGIDVGAKAEIHRLMSGLAREGKAIMMVASEMPEILGMSDRVLVMSGGRLTAEFSRADVTQEKVLEAATHRRAGA